jgi:hypothetical protein
MKKPSAMPSFSFNSPEGRHTRKMPMAPDMDLKTIARGTPGFTGADLMNFVNDGALGRAPKCRKCCLGSEHRYFLVQRGSAL